MATLINNFTRCQSFWTLGEKFVSEEISKAMEMSVIGLLIFLGGRRLNCLPR